MRGRLGWLVLPALALLGVWTVCPAIRAAEQAAEQAADAAPAAPAPAVVTFTFERRGLAVPKYSLSVTEQGDGRYLAQEAAAADAGQTVAAADGSPAAASPVEASRSLVVSAATAARVFAEARALKFFRSNCASRAKNIADSGAKTLTYSGPEGTGSCAYHYSESKPVLALTAMFEAIALTLDEGRRLDFMRRFDRLGVDDELASLAKASADGDAIELAAIRPTLEAIAADGSLMERARLRAVRLMDPNLSAKSSGSGGKGGGARW